MAWEAAKLQLKKNMYIFTVLHTDVFLGYKFLCFERGGFGDLMDLLLERWRNNCQDDNLRMGRCGTVTVTCKFINVMSPLIFSFDRRPYN